MTEYLYDDNKPLDPKNYRIKVGCINCDAIKLLDVIKGRPADLYVAEEKIKCPVCECVETLVSYNTWKAQRAMMNQIINMAKHEADLDRKGMQHIG